MINGNTVVTAFFNNTQETEINVFLERPDGSTFDTLIEAGDQSPEYKDLLKQITLEKIRKNTVEQQELEKRAILAYARSVFEEERAELENEMIRKLAITNDTSKDFAFKVKLAVFQKDKVKKAPTEVKKAIRAAESPLEVLYLTSKLYFEESDEA